MDRGDCSFVTKVRNIEKAGGSLAVIIDNTNTKNVRDIIMSDDGTGAGIRIPSMLISKKDGEILKEFLRKSDPFLAASAALSAEFVMENPDNTVEMQLWYTSSNDRAMDFIQYFAEEIDKFDKEDVEFVPRIVTWSCPSCDNDFKKKECVSGGKYCAMNYQSTYILGRDIIIEDLREVCLYKNLKSQGKEKDWWKYMDRVHELCYEYVTEDCSKSGHKHIG